MNVTKTKLMVISNNPDIQPSIFVAGQKLEQVDKYKYLGTWLTQNWDNEVEIKTRIKIACRAFGKMKKVLCNRSLKIPLRIRLLQCYIWPILLYLFLFIYLRINYHRTLISLTNTPGTEWQNLNLMLI